MADSIEKESAEALLEFKNGGSAASSSKSMDEVKVKEEIMDEDDEMNDDGDHLRLGPAALGLQRVGTQPPPKPTSNQPMPVLNARGMPARIRKKNRFFYDDDIVNTPHHRVPSAKKQKGTPSKKPKLSTPSKIKDSPRSGQYQSTPSKKHSSSQRDGSSQSKSNSPPPLQSPDRKIGQKIGMRLRNLLKLPKAHKWVCYEWFYSNIDKALFSGDNDFSICLKESFPELKTRELTRVEWTKIRRMMGRPRRCSQSFFNQERLDLEKKRNKIRAMQQRKVTDLTNLTDLPREVPMQLVIGTKVTARLRKPQDGLFTGSIDALDTSNNTYRITFERHGLGTHSVPDYEVLSNEPVETMPINIITPNAHQSRYYSRQMGFKNSPFSANKDNFSLINLPGGGGKQQAQMMKNLTKKDPLLSLSLFNNNGASNSNQHMRFAPFSNQDSHLQFGGNSPNKLLEKMVIVTKILNSKRQKIKLLKAMNSEAEKLKSFDGSLSDDFERKYAILIIDLEKLNRDLSVYLEEMQTLCRELAPEPSLQAMLAPSLLREKCKEEAREIVQRNNSSAISEKEPVSNKKILDLITGLTALMLQVKCLSDSDQNAYELQVLQGTMEQIKKDLSPGNKLVFQNCVEVHMKHIQNGLGQANHKFNNQTAFVNNR